MADTVFRSQETTTATEPAREMTGAKPVDTGDETAIEVPYLDYESTHPQPFLAEYFRLGDTWNDPIGGFPHEIEAMSKYIENKIKTGEIANSQKAVKNLIKGMEKINNLHHEERSVIRIEVLRNYMEFLAKNEGVRRNANIYGSA